MSNKLHKQTSSQYHKFHSTKQHNTADRQSNHHRLDNPNNQMPSTRKSTDPQPSRLTLTMHSILYNSLIMLYSHRILIAEPASQPSHVADDDPYRPQLPQKRPSDAMIALVMEEDGTLTLPRSHWGGSPPLGYGPRPRRCHQAYLASSQRKEDIEHLGKNPEDSDTSQGSDTSESEKEEDAVKKKGDGGPYKQGLSRAELKALDRELPWRKILEMPQSHIDKLIEAINKEAESWSSWQSVKPINDKDVDYILSHPTLKRRVLRSRGCYRDKAVGLGELRAKCRIVALGHLDPDLAKISRSTATPGRLAEQVVYTMICSGHNRNLFRTGKSWASWTGDAATAFLQGDQAERTKPLSYSHLVTVSSPSRTSGSTLQSPRQHLRIS